MGALMSHLTSESFRTIAQILTLTLTYFGKDLWLADAGCGLFVSITTVMAVTFQIPQWIQNYRQYRAENENQVETY